jgi:hypothetical protein
MTQEKMVNVPIVKVIHKRKWNGQNLEWGPNNSIPKFLSTKYANKWANIGSLVE